MDHIAIDLGSKFHHRPQDRHVGIDVMPAERAHLVRGGGGIARDVARPVEHGHRAGHAGRQVERHAGLHGVGQAAVHHEERELA